jgi:hypothetical protein
MCLWYIILHTFDPCTFNAWNYLRVMKGATNEEVLRALRLECLISEIDEFSTKFVLRKFSGEF